jgi:hypothetical protein
MKISLLSAQDFHDNNTASAAATAIFCCCESENETREKSIAF